MQSSGSLFVGSLFAAVADAGDVVSHALVAVDYFQADESAPLFLPGAEQMSVRLFHSAPHFRDVVVPVVKACLESQRHHTSLHS